MRLIPLWVLAVSLLLGLVPTASGQRFVRSVPSITELTTVIQPQDVNTNYFVRVGLSGKGESWYWDKGATDAASSSVLASTVNTGGRFKKVALDFAVDVSGFITNYTVITVPTVADLKNVPVTNGLQLVMVEAFANPGDGGGGDFVYDATTSDPDDGGIIHAPNNGTGKWRRIIDPFGGVLVPWWSGMVTNGSFQAAIDYAASHNISTVHLPETTFILDGVTNRVRIKSNVTLLGKSGTIVVMAGSPVTNAALFETDIGATNWAIVSATMQGWPSAPSGDTNNWVYGIYIHDSTDGLIDNCSYSDFYTRPVHIDTATASRIQIGSTKRDRVDIRDLGARPGAGFDNKPALINALRAHRHVYIPEGTWNFDVDTTSSDFNNAYISLPSNTLVEAHPNAIITMSTPVTNYCFYKINAGVSNVVIKGGQYYGYRNDNVEFFHTNFINWAHAYFAIVGDANNVILENLYLDSFGRGTISFGGPTNAIIRNCVITNARQNAIELTKGAMIKIQDCRIFGVNSITNNDPAAGIDIEPNIGDGVRDVTIEGNTFAYCERGVYVQRPATALAGGDLRIINNLCYSNRLAGMIVNTQTNVVVANNIFVQNGNYGLYSENVHGGIFTGNITRSNAGSGLIFFFHTNTIVSAHVSTDNGGSGFHASSGSYAITDSMFSKNTSRGINVVEAFNVLISGNTISNNGEEGIRLAQSEGCHLTGNLVLGNGTFGDSNIDGIIVETFSSLNTITGNKVRKSYIFNAGIVQAAGASTVTVSTNATSINDLYNGYTFRVLTGPGDPATNVITDYDGSSKVATVTTPWITPPDATTTYEISQPNRTRYPINIATQTCENNRVLNNDILYGGQASSALLNGGLNTITSLPIAEGGTSASTAPNALLSLGAAARAVNTDITYLNGLVADLLLTNGNFGTINGRGLIIKDSAGTFQYAILADGGDNLYLSAGDELGDVFLRSLGNNRVKASNAGRFEQYFDGTTGSAAYTWEADVDLGMNRISANIGSLVAGGAERFRWSTTGVQISGSNAVTGILAYTPSALQTLAAGDPMLANAGKVRVAGNGGPITSTAAPTIADGENGQFLIITGTSANTWTIQDQDTLPASNVHLGAATRVLGVGDILVLTYDLNDGVWYEVSFVNN